MNVGVNPDSLKKTGTPLPVTTKNSDKTGDTLNPQAIEMKAMKEDIEMLKKQQKELEKKVESIEKK